MSFITMSLWRFSLCLLLSCVLITVVMAVEIVSPKEQVALLELYTSEGCSSCPPADRRLSGLKSWQNLWHEIVPVAFHVDYWDYLGWRDRFASSIYSDRQRAYASIHAVSTIYTPAFLLNGQNIRPNSLNKSSVAKIHRPPVGQLYLNIEGDHAQVRYTPEQADHTDLLLNIAILGCDIKSDVDSGENHGRKLQHDFTVLGYKTVLLKRDNHNHIYSIETNLPDIVETAPEMAVSAWISHKNGLIPIQATGGWLTRHSSVQD